MKQAATISRLFLARPVARCTSGSSIPTLVRPSWARNFSQQQQQQPHNHAEESHNDFKPKLKAAPSTAVHAQPSVSPPAATNDAESLRKLFEQDVKSNPVFLYMKGTPERPMCGFSKRVVQILDSHGAKYKTRNVLESDAVREGIKKFSDWPTIPQLYVNQSFVGGCDIVTNLHLNGELKTMLEEAKAIKT